MWEVVIDAFYDSLRTVPLLLILYVGVELLEYNFGDQMRKKVQSAGIAGPLIGAIVGAFPQCGFSVIATALFTQRLVTVGTLLAVYLSTSDEAIPIMLSRPDGWSLVLPLIGIKIIIALLAGYGIDLIFKRDQQKVIKHVESVETGHDNTHHHHEVVLQEKACCSHSALCTSKKFRIKEIVWHPIVHTANVFVFIFLTTLAINLIIFQLGESAFSNLFGQNIFWQPLVTSLVGLIPNCASSVAITELYLRGVIGFGSTIAGLSASGGLGLLVLYREEKDKRNFAKIIALLYGISVVSGLILQIFVG